MLKRDLGRSKDVPAFARLVSSEQNTRATLLTKPGRLRRVDARRFLRYAGQDELFRHSNVPVIRRPDCLERSTKASSSETVAKRMTFDFVKPELLLAMYDMFHGAHVLWRRALDYTLSVGVNGSR